jgi:calcineurin-like phosphoesterase family protein
MLTKTERNNMAYFFTADTHFGHANILKYCDRPFADVNEMNEVMISNWCNVVKPADSVFILGDFGFSDATQIGRILDRLPGQKFLIYGNHDKTIKKNSSLRDKFVKCCDYYEMTVQDGTERQNIVLCHYAMLVWNRSHHGAWMLHGHSHGSLSYPYDAKILDVGVDTHNYEPYSYDQVRREMKRRGLGSLAIDHHTSNDE